MKSYDINFLSVQLLYAILSQGSENILEIIESFWEIKDIKKNHNITEEVKDSTKNIVLKVIENKTLLEKKIVSKLLDNKQISSIDNLVKAILLVGSYHIFVGDVTTNKAFYREFIKITSDLASPQLSGFVHAVLENIKKDTI